jgi:3-dehydroquinate synthase
MTRLPVVSKNLSTLLIFDQVLLQFPNVKKWIHKFPLRYKVKSGEELKDIRHFALHAEKILKIGSHSSSPLDQIFVLGGGTVGDFGGFIASVYRRGLPVVQIPSTWLAALDSAHGGKTALNVAGFKNQIGTFYFPKEVWIVREILEAQPPERLQEASGEFLKTALLGGEDLVTRLAQWNWVQGQIEWADLKKFIQVKYRILERDPFEKRGLRHVLNLGHTLGHAWEAAFQLPHGLAIYYGLLFDMAWSTRRGLLDSKRAHRILSLDPWQNLFDFKIDRKLFSLSEKKLRTFLQRDKKVTAHGLRYIFVQKPGRVVIQTVGLDEILKEYQRQKKRLEDFHEGL